MTLAYFWQKNVVSKKKCRDLYENRIRVLGMVEFIKLVINSDNILS